LPEARHLEEVGMTDDPSYYLYHKILGHPTKNYCIFKDVLQDLIDVEVLKLRSEQKKVTANMTATTGVVPIPRGELRVIKTDPHS